MNCVISSGLCGTYDGDSSNDRRYPDGRLDTSRASEPNEYIKSWRFVARLYKMNVYCEENG